MESQGTESARKQRSYLESTPRQENGDEVAQQFIEVMQREGVHAALAVLNARARFRFTGIYRVDPPLLRNLFLFDRENPTLTVAGTAAPLHSTYCGVVWASSEALQIGDSLHDDRFVTHASRASVISYMGVPVRGRDGSVAGTLCHFDTRPRLAPSGETAILSGVAAALREMLATRE